MTLYSHDWSKSDSAHSQDFSFYTGDIALGLNISVILSNDILEWPLYNLMLFCVLYSWLNSDVTKWNLPFTMT